MSPETMSPRDGGSGEAPSDRRRGGPGHDKSSPYCPARPAAGAAGRSEEAASSAGFVRRYFAIHVAMRAEVLSRWSAQNAESLRKKFRVFCGAVGRWGRMSGFTNLSAPFTIGP